MKKLNIKKVFTFNHINCLNINDVIQLVELMQNDTFKQQEKLIKGILLVYIGNGYFTSLKEKAWHAKRWYFIHGFKFRKVKKTKQ